MVGVSYRTAPVGLLGRVAIATDRLPAALAELRRTEGVREVVALATCNRTELYVHASGEGVEDAVLERWAGWCGMGRDELRRVTYAHRGRAAVVHLLEVTAGLDSMVVGEQQIQVQVKEAFLLAQSLGCCGRVLGGLFRCALRSGRRLRAEAPIAGSSMLEVGLDAAREALGGLAGRTVMIVGAGQMGRLAAAALAGGCGRLLIANRTGERAVALARRWSAEPAPFEARAASLTAVDLVVTSTGSAGHVLDRGDVEAAMIGRAGRPLVLLDLAVPADVDPDCAAVPGVRLLGIRDVLELTRGRVTSAELVPARTLVEEEADAFLADARAAAAAPTIAALSAHAEAIRRAELERLASRLAGADERQREAIALLSRRLVNRLHHPAVIRLRELAGTHEGHRYESVVRDLFGLVEG